MGYYYLLLFLWFSTLFHASSALSSDGLALLSLMKHWTFVPSDINSTWNPYDSTPCSWKGIRCNDANNVVSLNLSESSSISGQLGPEIGKLSNLQTIVLVGTNLSGVIPPELGNCTMLEHLELYQNKFNGRLPHSFRDLQKLKVMNLSANKLFGEIPESLFQIPYLETLQLNNNSLYGSIPKSIGNLTKLVYLDLSANNLSGTIPVSIGNCSELESLDLDTNNLHGAIPFSLNNLINLNTLYLFGNNLEGTIPLGYGDCKKLSIVSLAYNELSGSIPPGLGNCSNLQKFYAPQNHLVGSIPSTFGLLQKLSVLVTQENHLSGKIPPQIGNCESLQRLLLNTNELHGEIPSELGNLSRLQDLRLYQNFLTGEIPLGIWKIQSLMHVLVYNNSLSGELPEEMTELKNLQNVSLFNNHFSGVIPQSFGINSSLVLLDFMYNNFSGTLPPNLCFGKKLVRLNMGFNQFHGSIPIDVGRCTSLTRVRLESNKFTGPLPNFEIIANLAYMSFSSNNISGSIPSSLGNCTNLSSLDLSMNSLTGLIPSELGNLVNLQTLVLSHNKLAGPLPDQLSECAKMGSFDVGFNFLNGSFPSSLQNWTRLTALILTENRFDGGIQNLLEFKDLKDLQVGGNMFGGNIPGSIGKLQNLQYGLNLSANGLVGVLPNEIGNLKSLVSLDLSFNHLTGSIQVLEGLSSLFELDISYNSFEGPIPRYLITKFGNYSPAFLGNPGLCVSFSISDGLNFTGISYLRPCYTESKGLSKVATVLIALGCTIFVVFVLLGLVYMYLIRKSKQEAELSDKEGSSSLFMKVMEATENLNDKYIIGRGAHGVVYKAELGPGRVFAVKKIACAHDEAKNSSMTREVQTLGMIRHRNLLRLEDFWLRKDYGLILYRYMPNGSLHDALHVQNPPQSLDWNIRHRIAVGIAHGLAYLHHDCDPVIVHRDIKTSNVLLDSELEPHIADFGVAKLLDQPSTSSKSIPITGTIGYIAPENAYTTKRGKESDVYSYGVVLIELISRKEALDSSFMEGTDIVFWTRSIWEETGVVDGIVDSGLASEISNSNVRKQVTKVLLLAFRCTDNDPRNRPTMREVVKYLQKSIST